MHDRNGNGGLTPDDPGAAGEPQDLEHDIRLLTAPPGCLTRQERRDALHLARRLGRTTAEDETIKTVTLELYRNRYVQIAKVVKSLVDPGYWRRDEAVLDARVEAWKRGFAQGRAGGG